MTRVWSSSDPTVRRNAMSEPTQATAPETKTPAAGAAAAGVPFAPAEPALSPAPESDETDAPPAERRKSRDDFNGVDKRQNVVDRRTGLDRRLVNIGSPTGLERRRGPGCRRTNDRKSAEEGEMSDEQFEFVMAVDTY